MFQNDDDPFNRYANSFGGGGGGFSSLFRPVQSIDDVSSKPTFWQPHGATDQQPVTFISAGVGGRIIAGPTEYVIPGADGGVTYSGTLPTNYVPGVIRPLPPVTATTSNTDTTGDNLRPIDANPDSGLVNASVQPVATTAARSGSSGAIAIAAALIAGYLLFSK